MLSDIVGLGAHIHLKFLSFFIRSYMNGR